MHVASRFADVLGRSANRVYVGAELCELSSGVVLQTRWTIIELISLGRDPGYIKLNVQHTNHVLKSAIILNMFSKLLKPCVSYPSSLGGIACLTRVVDRSAVSYWLRDVPKSIDREMKYLHRLIDDRRQYLSSTYDGSPEKPVRSVLSSLPSTHRVLNVVIQNDLLMWLMEEAKGDEQSDRNLALRVLALNFAAIHTTSMVRSSFFVSCSTAFLTALIL